MNEIETFVFLDLETTGLPWLEKTPTKIIEFSFVAASKRNILLSNANFLPPMRKLSGIVNPQKKISAASSEITGLTNTEVKRYPAFAKYFPTIENYFSSLTKPICIVAHNGNIFDFQIFLSECCSISRWLPFDTLCIDSLPAFRFLFKQSNFKIPPISPAKLREKDPSKLEEDIMTSDSEKWSDIDEDELIKLEENISSTTDPNETIIMNDSFTSIIDNSDPVQKPQIVPKENLKPPKRSFALGKLYESLTGKQVGNAHRAEADCITLLECVIALKHEFIDYAEKNCKLLNTIERTKSKFGRRRNY